VGQKRGSLILKKGGLHKGKARDLVALKRRKKKGCIGTKTRKKHENHQTLGKSGQRKRSQERITLVRLPESWKTHGITVTFRHTYSLMDETKATGVRKSMGR